MSTVQTPALTHGMMEELLHAEEPQEAAIRARHNVSARHGASAQHKVTPSPAVTAGPRSAAAAPQEQLVWK